ncbi:MAG: hypothetical protein IJ233_00835 [Pyramidobacter sp.]|nr:hypothetical protein [Pyramidobacter sp.]
MKKRSISRVDFVQAALYRFITMKSRSALGFPRKKREKKQARCFQRA